jgi:hypothetical protein
MRLAAALGIVLCALPSIAFGQKPQAEDYKADERRIAACVEAAEKVQGTALSCLGQETETCERTTQGLASLQRMFCASSAEARAWEIVLSEAAVALRKDFNACDDKRCTTVSQTDFYEPLVPAFDRAHEGWLISMDARCTLMRIQAGSGTDRHVAPARCRRDEIAERAILYRAWRRNGVR